MSSFLISFVEISFNNHTSSNEHELALKEVCLSDSEINGTQLVAETRALVANYYSTSISSVSSSYLGQTSSGAYKYSYTTLGSYGGWVEWQIIGGDDLESALFQE
jgi:hypothetical protein